jgi:hypothetical protein
MVRVPTDQQMMESGIAVPQFLYPGANARR